jgi:hypothetical protein
VEEVGVKKDAYISECGKYRYWLSRDWDDSLSTICFVMLNPSTADADVDDPTIRRCIGFAKAWGFGGLEVRNLFAFRATDPDTLPRVADPVGPEGNDYLVGAKALSTVVCAWGNKGALMGRNAQALRLLTGKPLHCLGVTNAGHPKHPLYLAASTPLIPFGGARPLPQAARFEGRMTHGSGSSADAANRLPGHLLAKGVL